MSLKCSSCGLVNFNDASFCKRCGTSLNAAHVKQIPTDAVPAGINRNSLRPAFFFIGSMLALISVIFVFIGVHHQLRATRCSATTQGLLDEKYMAESISQAQIQYSESYLVRYTFSVQGRTYEGGDRLSTKPVKRETTVHYNPANPEDNLIEPQPVSVLEILLPLGLSAGAIGFFVLGVRKK